jgi:transcriptional regulator with XRE-family HTH domain
MRGWLSAPLRARYGFEGPEPEEGLSCGAGGRARCFGHRCRRRAGYPRAAVYLLPTADRFRPLCLWAILLPRVVLAKIAGRRDRADLMRTSPRPGFETGRIIRQERSKNGKTQKELAAEAGVRPEYISRLEKGRIPRPRDDIVERLFRAIGYNLRPSRSISDDTRAVLTSRGTDKFVESLLETLARPPRSESPSAATSDDGGFRHSLLNWLRKVRTQSIYVVGTPPTRELLPCLFKHFEDPPSSENALHILHLVGDLSEPDVLLASIEWKLAYGLQLHSRTSDGRVEIRADAAVANLPGVTPGAAVLVSSSGAAVLLLPDVSPAAVGRGSHLEVVELPPGYSQRLATQVRTVWERADQTELPKKLLSVTPVGADERSKAESAEAFDGALVIAEAVEGDRLVVKHELSSLLFPLEPTADDPNLRSGGDVWESVARRQRAELRRAQRVAQFYGQLARYPHRDIVSQCGIEGLAYKCQEPKDTRITRDVAEVRRDVLIHLRNLLIDFANYELAIIDRNDEPIWMENVFWELKSDHLFLECWFDNDLEGVAWWDIHIHDESVADAFRSYFDSLWQKHHRASKPQLVKELDRIIDKLPNPAA